MDLANLDTAAACDAGAEIELQHPVTQEPLGIYWGIKGKDSKAFRDHLRLVINEDLRKAAMAKKRGRPEEIPTFEKSEERSIEILVACSTHWRTERKVPDNYAEDGYRRESDPHLTVDGQNLPFTPETCRKVLARLKWIRDQVDNGIGDLENFMPI